jgi:molybdate transport system ATP-binding protein
MLSGTFDTEQPWYSSSSIAHVSFESHEEMLRRGGSVSKAIADGGNLTKAAQFLVVRFGLFPLLHRDVRTLSTGEIRKVLLVRALSNRPRLLILDNAFDGLDVPSREILKDLVSRTIKGFRVDILVQAVSAKAAAHTQILLITHREEEIVREIETFSILTSDGALRTFPRSKLCITDAFLTMGLGDSEAADPTDFFELPTEKEIAELWTKHKSYASVVDHEHLVQASNLYVRRGNATLLHGLNWTIQAGQRWLVAGGNGQGKSTLSRLLANDESGIEDGSLVLALSPDAAQRGTTRRRGVGWVSTELHMATARTSHVAMDLLRSDDSTEDTVAAVASWLNLDLSVLSRPFTELSQGQQKLVLIGAAMAPLPDILVLDEPCQGLDHVNRRLVLELIDRFCKATNICLVYITHHLEERIPSITHVLHLANGSPAYLGRVDGYDPTVIKVEQNPEDNKLIHCQ